MSKETTHSPVDIDVANIGGISETTGRFPPGVTVLSGRNATNRTSFLRAIMAALGSTEVALKGDANEGSVRLTADGETYTRTLSRQNGTTVFEGDPYLDDAELADLFAFLLESNDARRAVERGDDLYDVIMRPVDTDDIDGKIDQLDAERQELEARLEEFASLAQRLPRLEEERTKLEGDIEAKREELEGKQTELDELDADARAPSELEARLAELRETRNDLEDLRTDLEDEERIVDALRDDRLDVESDLDGLAEVDEDEVDRLNATIKRHRESIQTIESVLSDLQAVIQFNESLLEGDAPAILESLRGDADEETAGSITEKLLAEGEDVVCWTCGSRVERAAIERTITLLRDVHSEKIEERNSLREEIAELEAERKHLERTEDERRRLRQRLDEVETELEDRTGRIGDLESELDELESAVAEREAEIDALETDDHDRLLSLHREVNELEFELDRLESELDDVQDEIESVEHRVGKRPGLEEHRDSIDREIEALRTRIERLETGAVEQFNGQMEAILDLLEYDNLERIWIERVERKVKRGRRKEQTTALDLHVVRTTESGSVYEDTVEHLSESEREVVGLVFALSGYLVHEVYEQVPFMLLDSLEAFDSDRIPTLVDYFAQFAEYLVVALLPEDAAALDEDYQRITDI